MRQLQCKENNSARCAVSATSIPKTSIKVSLAIYSSLREMKEDLGQSQGRIAEKGEW